MEHSTIINNPNPNKVKSVKTRLDKFETTLNNSLDFIKKHKKVSSEETQLIELSFETMLSFLTNKSEEL